ncbi:MAG: hypothetical protein ACE37M_05005 [Henriciella sp.]
MKKFHEEYRYTLCYVDASGGFVGFFVTDSLSEAHKYLELRGWPSVPSDRNPNVMHGSEYMHRERVLLDSELFDGKIGSNVIARSKRKKKFLGIL